MKFSLVRLMEIKERQLINENYQTKLLEDILKELKGGKKKWKTKK